MTWVSVCIVMPNTSQAALGTLMAGAALGPGLFPEPRRRQREMGPRVGGKAWA